MNILTIKNLDIWYTQNNNIIENLSLEIQDNQIIGLIGLNGAGKTTLFNTICGIHEKYKCDEIFYCDKKITFSNNNFKHDRFIMFSEDESFQYFTFEEYLSYTFKCYNKKIDYAEIDSLCEKLNFTEYRQTLIRKLSLGNKRKVHLIVGLALHNKILILDEPFNGIDFECTEELYTLLKEYKKYGTIIFSSHILETICLITDKILFLQNGKIIKTFDIKEKTIDDIRKEIKNV